MNKTQLLIFFGIFLLANQGTVYHSDSPQRALFAGIICILLAIYLCYIAIFKK